jgi:DNA gyrase subunit A
MVEGLTATAEMSDIVKEYFGIFAKYVIGERAIPDVRDGLKPVHRRLVYAAWNMGAKAPHKPVKCAKIVGDTMGLYHPHGDQAIYDTLVRMTQEFAMRLPIFEGQGNFGSIDGDPPAAYRYTEARLFKMSQELFCNDLNDEVVRFVPNYDESTVEPEVLPSELPHLLLNYNTGIAVGIATEVLSCAPREVINCLLGEIREGTITKANDSVPKEFKGPDLPTAGIIEHNNANLRSLWLNGKSRWNVRGEGCFETDERTGKKRVVITSLPFQEKKEKWLESTAKLITEKKEDGKRAIEGVTDMRDESNKDGIRVVFDVATASSPEIILNLLYKKTNLSSSLSTGIVAIVDGKPKYLGVREIMLRWLDFRRECVGNILKKEKREKEERTEVVDGLLIVHSNLEKVIKTIRAADDSKKALIEEFGMTDRQASAVVAMRLGSLRKIDNSSLFEEKKELSARIGEIEEILADSSKLDGLIAERLEWWKEQLDARRTKIVREFGEISALDTIVERNVVVAINRRQHFKVTPIDQYRKVRRGGKGVKETDGEDPDDVPTLLAQVTTHDMLYAFTDRSRVFEKACHELPITKRSGKRQLLTELFPDLEEGEKVVAIMAMNILEMPEDSSVIMIRSNGDAKKLLCRGLLKKRGRLWGDPCCRTDLDDSSLVSVTLAEPEKDLIIFTEKGLFRRTSVDSLRPHPTRKSGASKCMTLGADDRVIGVDTISEGDAVSSISANGFGVMVNESVLHTKKGRVGKGCRLAISDSKSGNIVFGGVLSEGNELFVTTSGGKSIRISASDIREVGRGSRGVRVQKMGKGECIVAAAKIEVNGD